MPRTSAGARRASSSARRALVASAFAVALAAPATALAHGTESHLEADAVPANSATEAEMARETRAATAADAQAAAAAVAGTPGQIGAWSAPVPWRAVAIHTALLANGKVLTYDTVATSADEDKPTESYDTHTSTRLMVWDPVTGEQVRNDVDGFNLFCTGLAHLPDGRLFTAGGNKNSRFDGIVQTGTFSNTGLWAMGADMQTERWYPTVTAMANGEMLITAGQPKSEVDLEPDPAIDRFAGTPDTPEVRTTSGAIRQLAGATRDTLKTGDPQRREEYPWTSVAPNGEAFISGPEPRMRSIDTAGNGRLRDRGARDGIFRDYGSHAMYDIGKVLVSGGARPAVRSAVTIDINGETPQVRSTSPMTTERRQHNLTVLADGSVLATGGLGGRAEQVNLGKQADGRDASRFTAERWDPATGRWTELAAALRPRQYHSTALLLPDGRVLTAGGGICGACSFPGPDELGNPGKPYLAKDAEIFSPPYLFRADGSPAPRPEIAWAPETVTYDAPLEIATPQAGAIRKAALIRLGAVTHGVDMGQRYVPLQFSASEGSLTATGPRNANIAPPGPYMLVVTDAAGVPSVAKMVTVGTGGAPSVTLSAPASDSLTAPATVSLTASASAPAGSVAKVEFFNGQDKLGEDTSAPYAFDWTGVPAGTYAVSARVTDSRGASRRSPATTVTVKAAPPATETGTPGPVPPPVVTQPPTPAPPTSPTSPTTPVRPTPPAVTTPGPAPKPPVGVPTTTQLRITMPASVTLRGRTRTVPVTVSCARACSGTLRIETTRGALRGRTTFRMTKAGTRTYRVAVSAATRSLARRKAQRLRATVAVQAGSKRYTARRSFTLRAR